MYSEQYTDVELLFEKYYIKNIIVGSGEMLIRESFWLSKDRDNWYKPGFRNFPFRCYEKGIYCFWLFWLDEFMPLYIGSGILKKRIHLRNQYLLNGYRGPKLEHMQVSFQKFDNRDGDNMKKAEKKYIQTMCPVYNVKDNNFMSDKFKKNRDIWMDYRDYHYSYNKEYNRCMS